MTKALEIYEINGIHDIQIETKKKLKGKQNSKPIERPASFDNIFADVKYMHENTQASHNKNQDLTSKHL